MFFTAFKISCELEKLLNKVQTNFTEHSSLWLMVFADMFSRRSKIEFAIHKEKNNSPCVSLMAYVLIILNWFCVRL